MSKEMYEERLYRDQSTTAQKEKWNWTIQLQDSSKTDSEKRHGRKLTQVVCLPTVGEQELQMGHKNLPTGDAVALGQRKSDAVDVFLQRPSQMCINHRERKEEKHVTLISRESVHYDCSHAKGGAASTVPHKTCHSNSGKVHPRDFNAPSSLWCVANDQGIV